ncbi:uncharacterized protein PITG_11753 [Phytophthora infestans T30-4]|uniref:Uncharacterized protein n=1 Tax=Phytophthora infestans (strain T30-4) TaxID=403677 RepID=D0NIG6_PHYIT|nr:uncharacterized protein PITG_11753 [Phytophthora infestans T30-4]EEY59251.1 conserved hypothetical protein [Phytophthora infestans T30-4]|eukprot:XP_002901265.1 conserved hypothetical protein [Phytophthora infestans T30-4]
MSLALRRLRPAMPSVGKARQMHGLVPSAPPATASSTPILIQRRKSTAAESAATIARSEATRGPRCSPGLVVFDKDGTLIDFTLMWGGWIESQAWKVEMTTSLPVREKLFAAMGYDWISRSIKSKGALLCLTPVEPHNTIMVGDTSTDMLLGKNAGCGLSIGVLGGASSLDDLAEDADVLVPSIDRVIKVLFQYGQQAQRFGEATRNV